MKRTLVDIDELGLLAEKGLTTAEIAQEMGLPRSTVQCAAVRNAINIKKVSRGKKQKFSDAEIKAAAEQGLTVSQAMHRLGCSRTTVRTHALRLGLTFVTDPNDTRSKSRRRKPALPKIKTMADYAREEVAAMKAARMI